MILTFDIGNTNIKAAVFDQDKVIEQWRISTDTKRTGDEYSALLLTLFKDFGLDSAQIENVVVSSVVPQLIGAFVIVSQRLVRRICQKCGGTGKAPDEPGRRCRNCSGSGYRGRVAIFELMQINDEIRAAINAHKDTTEITAIARRHGMRTLREDGELKVQNGMTSESEVTRVCMLDIED